MQEAANHTTGTANYTWTGIIEFLQEQLNQNTIRQNEWLLEKQHLQTKLGKTEGELRALEQINADLVKRVKMLEFCLRKERVKYSALLSNKKITIPEFKNNNETSTLNQSSFLNPQNSASQSKRKTKGSRNAILKYHYNPNSSSIVNRFLEEVGYDDVSLDDTLALGERGLSIRNEVSQSQRNDISEPFYKYTDEADKSEQISVLDNSAFKKLDKSRDHQYGRSGEEKSYRTKTTSEKTNHAEITPSDKQQEWQQKCTLKGHFDGVRDIFVHSSDSIVCSVSEDCVIKVWDLKKLKKLSSNPSASIDSYLTLREHTGLLFAVTGPQMENFDPLNKRLLYTAGSEGIIRVWDLPLSSECETYPTNPRSYCLTTLNAHEDSIWELTHHPFKHSIMSTSSDGFIKIWETLNSNGDVITSGKIKAQFSQKIPGSDEPEYLVPTSASWIHSRINQIAAGYANLSSLVLFDEENGRNVGSLRYKSTHQDLRLSQPNKVISHPNLSLLIAGHEDKYLRFFDPNTNKQVHSILAHHDSVTNVCYQASTTNLLSVSHDGSLKIWDLRKYGLVQEISGIHLKKYDEQIHCVASDETSQLILTGGADGLVSVIERIL